MTDGNAPRIITSRATVMDGLVLDWWHTDNPNAGQPGFTPVLSVSREGILVKGYLNDVPGWWLDEASAVYQALAERTGPARDAVQQLVTHRYDRGAMKLVEVNRAALP